MGQVMEDMTSTPLLETQCRFWPAAETAAGSTWRAVGDGGPERQSKRSWIGRGARERKTQRLGFAEKLKATKGQGTPSAPHWDVKSTSTLQHFRPGSSSRSVKTTRKVELGGMGPKSTSLPSLHSKHGGLGKSHIEAWPKTSTGGLASVGYRDSSLRMVPEYS